MCCSRHWCVVDISVHQCTAANWSHLTVLLPYCRSHGSHAWKLSPFAFLETDTEVQTSSTWSNSNTVASIIGEASKASDTDEEAEDSPGNTTRKTARAILHFIHPMQQWERCASRAPAKAYHSITHHLHFLKPSVKTNSDIKKYAYISNHAQGK